MVQDDQLGRISAAEAAASGVTYLTIEGAPGMRFFDCRPYRAKLSTTACAQRGMAQKATGDAAARFEKCLRCPVGSAHSGQAVTYCSQFYGKSICTRCGRVSGRRLILNQRLCVSCFNRQMSSPAAVRLDRPIPGVDSEIVAAEAK
jgi:hypothetical protein